MNIWSSDNWLNILIPPYRSGLRLRFDKNVDDEVKTACKRFAKWLREEYVFPLRVPVYVKGSKYIKSRDGELVNGTCLRPFDIKEEPYIKIAAGDYLTYKKEEGRDNALASVLWSIAHELTHYFQHINGIEITLRGEEIQASRYATSILRDYFETTAHP